MIILIFLVVIIVCFPVIPFLIFNIHNVCFYGVQDLYNYIKYKQYNNCTDYGYVYTITADLKPFGSGKTLSAVHYARNLYKKYNGLKVWDPTSLTWVTQHIRIISNVYLNDVPFEKFVSEQQLITIKDTQNEQDVCIVLLDEASSVWNSRNFKSNISQELLKSLLQCRKGKWLMLTTSQRFSFEDALIRQITSNVWMANKFWRIQQLKIYSGQDLENCNNPDLIKPLRTSYFFIKDSDYNAYDTDALIDTMIKANNEGAFIPNEQILINQGDSISDLQATRHTSKLFKKRFKKHK